MKDLQNAKQMQISRMKELQQTIREKMAQVQDANLEDAKLTALKAARAASVERMKNPSHIPLSILIQIDPELKELNAQKEAIQRQRETIVSTLKDPAADPRVQQFDKQIKEIDKKISAIMSDADGTKSEEISKRFRVQEEYNLFLIDKQIREQEILVEMLQKRYNEQLKEQADRAELPLDASFEQDQVDRAKRILAQIEKRILALQTEGQRIPNTPDNEIPPNQLRQMNARLERIESLMHSIQQEQRELKSEIQKIGRALSNLNEEKAE